MPGKIGSRKKCPKCGKSHRRTTHKVCTQCEVGTKPAPAKRGVLSEANLRDKYDWAHKIRKAAKSIEAGDFYEEASFRDTCGVPAQNFRAYADLSEFDKYKGRAKGKVLWGNPKSIKRLKEDNVLS